MASRDRTTEIRDAIETLDDAIDDGVILDVEPDDSEPQSTEPQTRSRSLRSRAWSAYAKSACGQNLGAVASQRSSAAAAVDWFNRSWFIEWQANQ